MTDTSFDQDAIYKVNVAQADASDAWLRDLANRGGTQAPATPTAGPPAGEAAPARPPQAVGFKSAWQALMDGGSTVIDFLGRAGKDVAKGVTTEVVPQAVSGAVDTGNQLMQFADMAVRGIEKMGVPNLYFQLWDKDGNWDPKTMNKEEIDQQRAEGTYSVVQMPNWKDPKSAETVTGEVARFLGNYVTSTAVARPITAALGMEPSKFKLFVDDMVGAFIGMDPKQQTQLLEMLPAGDIRDFLVAEPGQEAEILERLKSSAIVGAGGLAFEGLVGVLRGLKNLRVKEAPVVMDGAPQSAAEQTVKDRLLRDIRDPQELDAIGADPLGPQKRRQEALQAEAAKEAAEPKRDWLMLGDPKGPMLQLDEEAVRDAQVHLARTELVSGGAYPIPKAKLNLEVIGGPEDVLQLISDTSVFTKVQGRQSVAERQAIARQIGIPIKEMMEGKNGWQRALSGEQIDNLGWVLRSSADQTLQLAKIAAETGAPLDKAKAMRALVMHRNIQEFAEGASAQTGRALNAWKKFAQEGMGSDAKQLKEALDNMGTGSTLDEMIDKLATLDDPNKAGELVKKAAEATSRDHFMMGYYNILLSNPASQVANIAGNTGEALWHLLDRYTAAQIGRMRGNPEDAVAVGEAGAYFYGMMMATRNAMRLAGRTLVSGEQTFGGAATIEHTSGLYQATPFRTETWRTGGANLVDPEKPTMTMGNLFSLMMPVRWMGATDDFFKWMNYQGELHAQAFRDASQAKLKDPNLTPEMFTQMMDQMIANPTKAMDTSAVNRALEGTFNKPLGEWMNKFMGWVDGMNVPVQHTDFEVPVGRILMPFVRTPTNLIKWSYNHSPVAAMFPSSRIRQALEAGGAERDLAIAKMTTGSMVSMSIAEMVMSGRITGGGPSDPELSQAWKDAGYQPYSIKIGDSWYSTRRLSPVGDLLGITADAVEIMNYANDRQREDIANALVFAWANAFSDKTYFQGAANVFEAMDKKGRDGEKFWGNLAASFNPAIVRQAEKIVNPEIQMAKDFLDAIKKDVPYFSDSLPADVDNWGRTRKSPPSWMPFVDPSHKAGLISPITVKKATDAEPVDKFVWENRMEISKMGRVQRFQKGPAEVDIELTNHQLARLRELAGNGLKDSDGMGAKDHANALVTGKHSNVAIQTIFNNGTTETKVDIVRDILVKFRRAARMQLLAEDDTLREVYEEGFKMEEQKRQPAAAGSGSPTIGGGAPR